MESNLFVNLSDEQQELVAGGGQLIDADLFKEASYKASVTSLSNAVASSGDGSAVVFELENASVDTYAFDDIDLEFD